MRRYCQHLLQKLSNNGGVDAATEQMKAKQYAEPFKADRRKVIALAIEKAPGAIRIGGFFRFMHQAANAPFLFFLCYFPVE